MSTLKDKLKELIADEHDEAHGYDPTWADVRRIVKKASAIVYAVGRNTGLDEGADAASEFVNNQNGPWNASDMREAVRKLKTTEGARAAKQEGGDGHE